MRFTQRFALYLLPTVWRLGVSFAVLPLVTYRLGPADYGLYALIISLSNLGSGASALGAAYPLSAHFQKLDIEGQRDLVSTLLWLGLGVAAVFAALVVAGWPLLERLVPDAAGVSGSVKWIAAALIVLATPWSQAVPLVMVTGRAGNYAYVGVMESLGSVAATLIALYIFDLGAEALFIGTLVGAMSNAAASLTSLRNFLGFRFSRYWMSECLHVGWLSALTSLVDRSKTTLESYALARFAGVATLGIYFHSQIYMNVTRYGLVNAISSATWPMALHEARMPEPERTFPNLGRIWPAAQVGLALAALAMATLGGDFIGLLTHGKFNAAHIFAALWIVVIMFENASMPAVALMYAHDHGVANQRVVLLGGVLSLVLMIPLIAWLGAYGAILAQLIGVLVYRALVFVLARRVSPFPFQDRTLLIGAAVVLASLAATMRFGETLIDRALILVAAAAFLLLVCRNAWRPALALLWQMGAPAMARLGPDRRRRNSGTAAPRILFVISGLKLGGTERQVAMLAAELTRKGLPLIVYSLMDGEMREAFERLGAELIVAPGRLNSDRSSRMKRMCFMPLAVVHLLWIMLTRRPAIVHFFLPAAYLIGAPLAAIARLPVRVMSRRSLNNYQNSGLVRALERRLHRSMQAVIGNSRSVIGQLQDEGVPPQRLALIYNGLDAAAYTTPDDGQRERLGLPRDALVMCIVANLIAYKGHRDLIDALAIAAPDLPPEWRLLVVGRDDGIGGQLREQARRLGLLDHIQFLGARGDVPALLAMSDIGLLCSHEEGFANAILEGMAAGLPMIVTDVGGNAEAVADGVTGFIVPAKDPARLAAAIVRLARDPALRGRLGAAGQRQVRERFAVDRCIAAYEKLYRTLLEGGVPGDIAEIRVG